ncbi:hypothetical protein ILUMI_11398 [Ignelater luminosus]|uniref:G-protein coupled receptors family 1 profile domain-containing protein n=1 Tax=Ignelater luminosus TaxID=2038154 RepID=A0A8K0D534_IGNLU|nr:hypothetical protein ILUMI_11398 [Ignelater luminosus]
MDYENIEDVTNSTYEDGTNSSEYLKVLPHEIVITVICFVGLCTNVAIIYIILKFKQMHAIPNILLENWIIADICSLIVTPSTYRITFALANFKLNPSFLCSLLNLLTVFRISEISFATVIVIDWITNVYYPKISKGIKLYYKHIITCLWIAAILFAGVSVDLCINYIFYFYIPEVTELVSYSTLLVLVLIANCVRIVMKCKKKPLEHSTHMLTLVTSLVVTYFLGFVFTVFFIHSVLAIFVVCLVYLSTIFTFLILYFINKEFQMCIHQIFRRSNDDYADSILDATNRNSNAGQNNSMQICFHNPVQEMLGSVYYNTNNENQ